MTRKNSAADRGANQRDGEPGNSCPRSRIEHRIRANAARTAKPTETVRQ